MTIRCQYLLKDIVALKVIMRYNVSFHKRYINGIHKVIFHIYTHLGPSEMPFTQKHQPMQVKISNTLYGGL